MLDAWGEAPLRLDVFTATDRASVLNLLLADGRVQAALAARRKAALGATVPGLSPGGTSRQQPASQQFQQPQSSSPSPKGREPAGVPPTRGAPGARRQSGEPPADWQPRVSRIGGR